METTYKVQRITSGDDHEKHVQVLFDNLDTENAAWEAGHTWLMEHDLPYVSLDILDSDGYYIDMISWEP